MQIGGTPRRDNPEFYGGNNLWVSVRELNNNVINDTKEHITDIGVEQSNVKLIPENTVLYSFKLSIGKIAITGKPLYTNEAIAGLLIKNKKELLTKYLYYALCFINKFSSKGCIGNGSLNKSSLGKVKIPIISIEKQNRIISFLDNLYSINGNIKNTIDFYKTHDIFKILLTENYEMYNCLVIAQNFNIKLIKLTDIITIREELLNVQKIKSNIIFKINANPLFISDKSINEPIDELQNEIVSVEEEVIIEPKPKTKIIIKKKN